MTAAQIQIAQRDSLKFIEAAGLATAWLDFDDLKRTQNAEKAMKARRARAQAARYAKQ